jgi:hypothetical protein
MPNNDNKRCPQCGGAIDYFGSCRRCGREWSDGLEEDETAEGLKEGEQHPSLIKPPAKKKTRNRYTKNSAAADPNTYLNWQIGDNDDEVEIIKKRSLMRLDSRKTYNAMGLALRAHEAEKGALLWLSRLWEFLSEKEQVALTPALEHLKRSFADVKVVAQAKVNEAAKMEIEMEKAHKSARLARVRLMEAQAKRRIKEAAQNEMPKPGEDSEGFGVPDLVTLDPAALDTLSREELLDLAKHRLSNLDQEKALRKRADKLINDDTSDE